MALEQADAKVLLQRLHALADAGSADAEVICGMAEVLIFGDCQCLDQRDQRNTGAKPERRLPGVGEFVEVPHTDTYPRGVGNVFRIARRKGRTTSAVLTPTGSKIAGCHRIVLIFHRYRVDVS